MMREGKTLQIAGKTIKIGYEGPVKPWTKKLQKFALVGGLLIWGISSLVNAGHSNSPAADSGAYVTSSSKYSPAMLQWARTLKNDIDQCNTDFNRGNQDANGDADNATVEADMSAVSDSCHAASIKVENLTVPKSLIQENQYVNVKSVMFYAFEGTRSAETFVSDANLVSQGDVSLTGYMHTAFVNASSDIPVVEAGLSVILANQ